MDKQDFIDRIYFIVVVLLLVIVPTWFNYGDSEAQRRWAWLIQFESWGIRQLAFPLIVLLVVPYEAPFWAYGLLTFFTLFSNVSDVGFIDKYDNFFRAVKIGLWIITATYVIDHYYPFFDKLKLKKR